MHACSRAQVWDLLRTMDRPVRVQRATPWAEKARLTRVLFAASGPVLLVGCSNGKVGHQRPVPGMRLRAQCHRACLTLMTAAALSSMAHGLCRRCSFASWQARVMPCNILRWASGGMAG